MTMGALVARVLVERRRVLLPLGIAALVNLGVYALAVYPLSLKVASSERRAVTARAQLQAAEREDATTRTVLERAEQADADLQKFYRDTLPSSVEGARRMSYAKLASLADHHGLVIERRSYDRDTGYRGRLHKLKINMALSGEYRDIRAFLHALETSPEFVVIEDVSLSEGANPGAPLAVAVQLATYYAGAPDGA
jgi:Tfp pilus assembly protein PilO